jgi:hypothetical protein
VAAWPLDGDSAAALIARAATVTVPGIEEAA